MVWMKPATRATRSAEFTDAVLPFEFAHTDTDPVMTEEGSGFTLTVALPEGVPEQAASETEVTE